MDMDGSVMMKVRVLSELSPMTLNVRVPKTAGRSATEVGILVMRMAHACNVAVRQVLLRAGLVDSFPWQISQRRMLFVIFNLFVRFYCMWTIVPNSFFFEKLYKVVILSTLYRKEGLHCLMELRIE